METIKFNKFLYVSGDYVLNKAPIYAKGCRSSRDIIKKKTIDEKSFVYARQDEDGKWSITDGKSAKFDKVFIRKKFIDENIPELQSENKTDKQIITDDKGTEKAPEIIHLEDTEKFHDDSGNVLEIETRGEREHDKIYFKVKDVSVGFQMERLYTVLLNHDSMYKETNDFKYFICKNSTNNANKTSKKVITSKELFLTFEGMLRVLFVSRNNKTSKFIDWATKTLFTAQMGTQSQKETLAAETLKTTVKVIRELFNKNARSLPCVYLFSLGTVKELRTSMKIDASYADNSLVCKYGYTDDLARRSLEHEKTYASISGCNLNLKLFAQIDPQFLSKAEVDIKDYMVDYEYNFIADKQKELVIIPENKMQKVEREYKLIATEYVGHNSELTIKIKELQSQLEKNELSYKVKLQELQIENQDLKHQITNLTHKNEISELKHTTELLKMQNELNMLRAK